MNGLLSGASTTVVHIISSLGYLGLGFLMTLQTVAVPIPSEVILPFAGFLASMGRFNLLLIAIVGGLGSCVGSSIAYFIGDYGGRPLVERYGKYVLISHSDLDRTEKFFVRFGSISVFIGQLLPIVRSFIGFASGLAKENYKKFLLSVFFGSFLWSLLLGFVGEKLGENWGSLKSNFHNLDLLVITLIVIGVAFWIYKHFRRK